MPTTAQLQLRAEQIVEYVAQLGAGDVKFAAIPKNFQVAVAAAAIEKGFMQASDVPQKIARDVAENFLKEAPWRERDRAAVKGTAVHDIAERISNGEVVEVPKELANHVESWKQWRDHYDMEFIKVEFTVYSAKHNYAGTGDFIGRSRRFPELGVILGDYKTSESGLWPDMTLQLSGLRGADFIGNLDGSEDHHTLKTINSFMGVQITADGWSVADAHVTPGTFRVFLASTVIADWTSQGQYMALTKHEFVPRKEKEVA